jgi:hypothetical protein
LSLRLISSLVFSFLIAILLLSLISIVNASAIQGYSYVKTNTVMGSPDGALQDYPIKFVVHSGHGTDYSQDVYLSGHSESWPNDLRFTDSSNNLLSYWIESYDTDSAIIWVNVSSIPISPRTTTINLYYGMTDDPGASDGAATFSFFDDFNGGSIDASKWTVSTMGGGSVTESGGLLSLIANANQNARLTSALSFTRPMVIGTQFEPVISSDPGVRDRLSSSGVLQAPFSFDTGIFNVAYEGNRLEMYWGGVSAPTFSINTFYKSEEVFIPGISLKWTIYNANQAILYSNISSTSKTSYKPDYAVGDFPQPYYLDYGYMDLDWMYVRSATANEPIHGAWGSEVSMHQTDLSGLTLITIFALLLAILVIIVVLIAMFILIGYLIGKRKQ